MAADTKKEGLVNGQKSEAKVTRPTEGRIKKDGEKPIRKVLGNQFLLTKMFVIDLVMVQALDNFRY